jgi:transcriptional regulator with XRE-family HTH domain
MQTEAVHTAHEGRNVKRIREILGVKQELLALELGISQQAVSQLEQKEAIDKEMIEKISKILKVSPDAIKNFNEEATLNIISNTFNSNDNSTLNAINHSCSFNPFDKIVELYEALLKSEREKIKLMERMLGERR